MTVKIQRDIEFESDIDGLIIDQVVLKTAIYDYLSRYHPHQPIEKTKKIFMYGRYPGISIHGKKIHIHRLLMLYLRAYQMMRNDYVDHIDGNRLNASLSNLRVLQADEHQSITNKGRKQTKEWIDRRIDAVTKTRYRHSIYESESHL